MSTIHIQIIATHTHALANQPQKNMLSQWSRKRTKNKSELFHNSTKKNIFSLLGHSSALQQRCDGLMYSELLCEHLCRHRLNSPGDTRKPRRGLAAVTGTLTEWCVKQHRIHPPLQTAGTIVWKNALFVSECSEDTWLGTMSPIFTLEWKNCDGVHFSGKHEWPQTCRWSPKGAVQRRNHVAQIQGLTRQWGVSLLNLSH